MAATAVLALALTAFAFAVAASQQLPEGPVEVTWDREACAHCRMHVGERAFAAQLQLRDGRVLNFDDPGCLLRYQDSVSAPEVHATWFHHSRQDRWVPLHDVAFVETHPTPMGFGLGAVHRGTPGAMSYEEAQQRVARPAGALEEHSSW